MYFGYLLGSPPTPVRASSARWVGVRIHIYYWAKQEGIVIYYDVTIIIQVLWRINEHIQRSVVIFGKNNFRYVNTRGVSKYHAESQFSFNEFC